MALVNPIDGFEVFGSTVWGTHIDESTTITRSGSRSIHFLSGSNGFNTQIRTDDNHSVPIDSGRDYYCQFTIRASSTTGGDNLRFVISWLDEAEAFISQTIVINTGVAVANTFEVYSATVTPPSTARFARIIFAKVDGTFDGYIDDYIFIDATPRWRVSRNTAQVIPSGSGDTVKFDTTNLAIGVDHNTTTGLITINEPGIYTMQAAVFLLSLAQDSQINCTIVLNTATTIATGLINYQSNATAANINTVATATYVFAAGDTVQVDVSHDHGSNRNTDATGLATYFNGTRVE